MGGVGSVMVLTFKKSVDSGTGVLLKFSQRQENPTEARLFELGFFVPGIKSRGCGVSDKAGAVATGISYTTSGTTVAVGTMTANEVAAYTGIMLGVLTFVINWYYRHKTYQLAKSSAKDA